MNKKNTPPEIDPMDKPLPLWVMILMPIYIVVIFGALLFPISGDWKWLEAWLFIITFALNISISYFFINKVNPRVLRNRMKTRKEGLTAATRKSGGADRFILPIMGAGFFGALILPAVEHRFGWPSLPFFWAMVGLVITNAGSVIMELAMLQNAHASKILDIRKGQELIDIGLYSRVRHPLYSGAILMILCTPVALGSWWGVIPAVIGSLTLVWRIKFEEQMLVKGMDGYIDYQKRVKYKLIPGIY